MKKYLFPISLILMTGGLAVASILSKMGSVFGYYKFSYLGILVFIIGLVIFYIDYKRKK